MEHEEHFCPLEPMKIFCKVEDHGFFYETPLRHLLGYGCPVCDIEDPDSLSEKLHDSFEKLMEE